MRFLYQQSSFLHKYPEILKESCNHSREEQQSEETIDEIKNPIRTIESFGIYQLKRSQTDENVYHQL